MSSTWREFMSWNKYTQVASRALRQALTETDRVAAEKRAAIGVALAMDDMNVRRGDRRGSQASGDCQALLGERHGRVLKWEETASRAYEGRGNRKRCGDHTVQEE
uniref:Uncharacterized protein n=1 Tax=Kwoniella dejecticola CBS 10117 TaxID=1296121 RepID=A0A1A6ACC8_9TREE|nr:uncharacterized protein I303_01938 [Kwoniella dejecticola CBS 10117]OBR87726.1 hypothetical protein I303_01938 [Kwoniella dejecticola CBS 10117]